MAFSSVAPKPFGNCLKPGMWGNQQTETPLPGTVFETMGRWRFMVLLGSGLPILIPANVNRQGGLPGHS